MRFTHLTVLKKKVMSKRYKSHFRLIDLTRDDLCDKGISTVKSKKYEEFKSKDILCFYFCIMTKANHGANKVKNMHEVGIKDQHVAVLYWGVAIAGTRKSMPPAHFNF